MSSSPRGGNRYGPIPILAADVQVIVVSRLPRCSPDLVKRGRSQVTMVQPHMICPKKMMDRRWASRR